MIFRRRHARPDPPGLEQAPDSGALRPQHVLAMTGAALNMAEGSAAFLSAVRILDERGRKNRLWIWILGVVCAVLLAMSATVVYLLLEQRDINGQLQATTAQLQATTVQVEAVQERTSNQVLCPFFKIFVDSFTPAARAKQPPESLKAYDDAVVKIRSGYAALGCPVPPSPPAAHSVRARVR